MGCILQKAKEYNRHLFVDSEAYPFFRRIEGSNGASVIMEGKEVIMAGSNNYLGLSEDPRVKEAAVEAIYKYGTSNSGSRFMNGTLDLHEKLEEKLALFLGKEASITVTTGFQSNQGAIVPLVGKYDFILSDKENHNSIVQGNHIVKGMYGSRNILRYNHNNMEHLEKLLSRIPLDAGKLIISDGVFSMSGIIVNLPGMVKLAEHYNATILLDEAHAIGVLGERGNGTGFHYGLNDKVDLVTGTFSKSLGSIGGFIAGESTAINYIKHNSPAIMFSASIAPPQVAAALKSLEILIEEPEQVSKAILNAVKLRSALKELGFVVVETQTPIVPILFGDDSTTLITWKELMRQGIYTNVILWPAVPQGNQMIRISLMSSHNDEHIQKIIAAFQSIKVLVTI